MSVSVIQLTDLHLLADTAQDFKGQNPWRNLNRLLAQIACERQPDLYLLTGDLCQDHSPQAASLVYQMLAERMDQTGTSWQWIPGNHDEPQLMATFKTPEPSVVVGDWQWLLLNSNSGSPHGEL
ncbi:metallophosphoesterase, partial [Oceanospirillum sp. HFRX-1_2]